MRIKKRKIIEAIVGAQASNNNNPTASNNNNSTSTLPNPNELNKVSAELEDIKKIISELPFFKEIGENYDVNYGNSEDLEYLSSVREKLMSDYNDWLSSPEGIEYMQKLHSEMGDAGSPEEMSDDLPFNENFKSNKKVIKTIKVKDL